MREVKSLMGIAAVKYERVYMFLDLGVFFALFFTGLGIGQYVSGYIPDIWSAYNCSVISVALIGELVWRGIKKAVAGRLYGKKDHK